MWRICWINIKQTWYICNYSTPLMQYAAGCSSSQDFCCLAWFVPHKGQFWSRQYFISLFTNISSSHLPGFRTQSYWSENKLLDQNVFLTKVDLLKFKSLLLNCPLNWGRKASCYINRWHIIKQLGLSSEELASMSRITAQLLQQLPGGSLDVRWDYHTF